MVWQLDEPNGSLIIYFDHGHFLSMRVQHTTQTYNESEISEVMHHMLSRVGEDPDSLIWDDFNQARPAFNGQWLNPVLGLVREHPEDSNWTLTVGYEPEARVPRVNQSQLEARALDWGSCAGRIGRLGGGNFDYVPDIASSNATLAGGRLVWRVEFSWGSCFMAGNGEQLLFDAVDGPLIAANPSGSCGG
jgi:hypothetical protein